MGTPLRVLLIEDSEDDALLELRELRRGGFDLEWQRVETAPALENALAGHTWDVILCDYVMPQFDGPAALKLIRQRAPDIPVVIVSGQIGEEFAVAAVKSGADDYVMKGNLTRLLPAIQRELRDYQQRQLNRQTAQTLREVEARFRALVQDVGAVVWEGDAETCGLTYISQQVETLTGFPLQNWIDEPRFWIDHVHPNDRDGVIKTFRRAAADRLPTFATEYRLVAADGREIWFRHLCRTAENEGRVQVRGLMIDMTERRRAEEELQRRRDLDRLIATIASKLAASSRGELPRAIEGALEAIARFAGAECCYIALFGEGDGTWSVAHQWLAPNLRTVGAALEGLSPSLMPWALERLRTGETIAIDDASLLPPEADAERAFLNATGIVAALSVPFASGHTSIGFLGFASVEARKWTSEHVVAATVLGEILAEVLHRKKVDDAARADERMFELVVRQSPLGVVLTGRDGTVTYANPAALDLLGAESLERLKEIGSTAVDSALPSRFVDMLRAVPASGESQQLEVHGNGLRPMSLSIKPLHGHHGALLGAFAMIRDLG